MNTFHIISPAIYFGFAVLLTSQALAILAWIGLVALKVGEGDHGL